jgi:hypothetical protein
MFENLVTAADRRAAAAIKRQIDRLRQTPVPPGVMSEANDVGITLTGKRLRRRLLNDPNLRNFGR